MLDIFFPGPDHLDRTLNMHGDLNGTYAVDTLEAHLGVKLFERGTTRRAKLSRAGEAVVAEAKALAYSEQMLRARVKGLQEGLETEISLAVDAMFPSERLVECSKVFRSSSRPYPFASGLKRSPCKTT